MNAVLFGLAVQAAFAQGDVFTKPVSVEADTVMDAAVWIAEATVADVGAAAPMGRGESGSLSVQIVVDAPRVFRGHALLGKTVDLLPPAWGPSGCTADFAALRKSGARVLVVADKDGRVPMIGEEIKGAAEPTYRLRSWCDYNAWWIYAKDAAFGKSVKLDEGWGTTIEITVKQFADRYRADGAMFRALEVQFLVGPEGVLGDDAFAAAVRRLGDDDPAERDRASAELADRGRWNIEALRKAEAATDDPEVKARLARVVTDLVLYAQAWDAATAARAKGAEAEAAVLVESFTLVDEKIRPRVAERLNVLGRGVEPPLFETPPASTDALLSAWRRRLKLP